MKESRKFFRADYYQNVVERYRRENGVTFGEDLYDLFREDLSRVIEMLPEFITRNLKNLFWSDPEEEALGGYLLYPEPTIMINKTLLYGNEKTRLGTIAHEFIHHLILNNWGKHPFYDCKEAGRVELSNIFYLISWKSYWMPKGDEEDFVSPSSYDHCLKEGQGEDPTTTFQDFFTYYPSFLKTVREQMEEGKFQLAVKMLFCTYIIGFDNGFGTVYPGDEEDIEPLTFEEVKEKMQEAEARGIKIPEATKEALMATEAVFNNWRRLSGYEDVPKLKLDVSLLQRKFPHLYKEVITYAINPQDLLLSSDWRAKTLAEEITRKVKTALGDLVNEVNSEISENWQDLLASILFPDRNREDFSDQESQFFNEVIQELSDKGLSDEEIDHILNQIVVLRSHLYKEIFYSPLAGAYLYLPGREEDSLRYRRMFWDTVDSLFSEREGYSFQSISLGLPEQHNITYASEEDKFVLGYNLSDAQPINSISFPILGRALQDVQSLNFEIKSSTRRVRRRTVVEASSKFQIGFRYVDEAGDEHLVLKSFDELVPGFQLSGDYQKVSIDLSQFGEIPWDKVTDFVIYFNNQQITDKKTATLYFKDLQFSSSPKPSGEFVREIVEAPDAKRYLEEHLGRPLLLPVLEDRILLDNFSWNVRRYLEEGNSPEQAYRRAGEEISESSNPQTLIPFIEELMFSTGREFHPGATKLDEGVWNYWSQRISSLGGDVSPLKRELAIKIFQLPSLQRWAYPSRVRGEYLLPDNPFIRRELSGKEFLETVGMGYLKYFRDTYDEVSGLWYDNSMEIDAEDPVISLPGIAGGLVAIPLMVEYGIIDRETGYQWAHRALETLVDIQRHQDPAYLEGLLSYIERNYPQELPEDWEELGIARKMQSIEKIRIDAEIKYLEETTGVSLVEFLQSQGIENAEELVRLGDVSSEQKYEFLRVYSPIFKYGWAGFLYRYMTQEEIPQRKVRWDLVNDLSVVDTSYVVYSALTLGQYFGGEVLGMAEELYKNINWQAFLDPYGTMPNLFNMGWLPESIGDFSSGYLGKLYYEYATDEALMIALLAAISPTHSVSPEVFDALYYGKAGYKGGPEYVLSPTGALFTYNLLDLWVDFSDYFQDSPVGEVNWDLNRRIAVLTNWKYAQELAEAGFATYGPYTWAIDTGYTPSGLRMDQGFAFKVGEEDPAKAHRMRNRETTTYTITPFTPSDFRHFQEAINAMAGYTGSALNSLRAILSFRKIMQAYYKMWGEYGVRDSFSLDEDILRGGGFIPNVWNSYDQMRGLNIFNLLGKLTGKVTPRDLFMSLDLIQEGLERIGFQRRESVEPVEIVEAPTAQFTSVYWEKRPLLTSALETNDINQGVKILHQLWGIDGDSQASPRSKGDFKLLVDLIEDNLTAENKDLANLLVAEVYIAQAVTLAKAACGEEYQTLIEGRNVDLTSVIEEYLATSDILYQHALDALKGIDQTALPSDLKQLVRGLELVAHKNRFSRLNDVLDAYSWFHDVTQQGVSPEIAEVLYKFDYDGELFGVYTQQELQANPQVMVKVFEPLREEYTLEPLLPEDAGVLSYFAEQVDGHDLMDIMEEIYIQSALKPYVELVLGRPLDVTNPDGRDAGFLAGFAGEVHGGLKDGPNDLDMEIKRLKFLARFMRVADKNQGAKYDLATHPHTQAVDDILGEVNLIWKGYITGKFNLLKPKQGIPPLQTKCLKRPVEYFATALSKDEVLLSEGNSYKGAPSLVIDKNGYRLPILLGNWYLPNQLKFALKSPSEGTTVRIVITNSKGETASYRIENVGRDWKEVEIPMWGPYWVPWMTEKENAEWFDWLTRTYWRKDASGEYRLKSDPDIVMEYDRISDWTDIVEVRVEKDTPQEIYLGGVCIVSEDKTVDDMRTFLTATAQAYFDRGDALVIRSLDDVTYFVLDVSDNQIRYIQVDPPQPPQAAQGFWDFRRGLGWDEYKIQTMNLNDFLKDVEWNSKVIILKRL